MEQAAFLGAGGSEASVPLLLVSSDRNLASRLHLQQKQQMQVLQSSSPKMCTSVHMCQHACACRDLLPLLMQSLRNPIHPCPILLSLHLVCSLSPLTTLFLFLSHLLLSLLSPSGCANHTCTWTICMSEGKVRVHTLKSLHWCVANIQWRVQVRSWGVYAHWNEFLHFCCFRTFVMQLQEEKWRTSTKAFCLIERKDWQ